MEKTEARPPPLHPPHRLLSASDKPKSTGKKAQQSPGVQSTSPGHLGVLLRRRKVGRNTGKLGFGKMKISIRKTQ